MRKRPLALLLFSIIMFGSALSLPIQVCITEEISIFEAGAWLSQLTLLNFLSMISMTTAAVLAYNGSAHLMVAIPANFLIVLANNLWVGYVGLNFSFVQTSLASAGILLVSALLLEKKTFAVLRNQKLRWWRAAERKKVNLPISLHPWVGDSIAATTFDLSESGAFIATSESNTKLAVGDKMQLCLRLQGHIEVRCTARLVRKANAVGAYPAGMGVIFEDLSGAERKYLREAAC